ncbi:hypothetical protein ACIBPB_07035 [Micromonospora sp. NPDC049836]|uniref:hypothetical protein n=1 Tax=Micromonospora sp. NPDC049836 TaxID=3364274 RepID=UPI00379E9387
MGHVSARNRVLTILTACLASAAVAAVVAMAVPGPDREHDHHDHAHVDTTSGLLVTTRSTLRMCVENAGRAGAPDVRTDLLAGLALVRAEPDWAGAYGRTVVDPARAVQFGCPAPRLPQRAGRAALAGPGVTDTPSAFRIWVYVLDDPSADRILGASEPAGLATAELMREQNSAWPVSTALLIRGSRLADSRAVARGLGAALGLVAPDQVTAG